MMKKLTLITLVVVFATSIGFGSVYAAETIKIGFHAPLTGFAASDGKSASEGAKLAVEQINAAGGVNGKMLELVIYDDQAKPAQAIPIANKLIGQDEVTIGVSGSYSGPTRSAAGRGDAEPVGSGCLCRKGTTECYGLILCIADTVT